MTRRGARALLVPLALAALAGCGGSGSTPAVSPSRSPVVATIPGPAGTTLGSPTGAAPSVGAPPAAAAVTARAAWSSYVTGMQAVLRDGGRGADRVGDLAVGQAMDYAEALARYASGHGWRLHGAFALLPGTTTAAPQTVTGRSPLVKVTSCMDSLQTRWTDRSGKVVPRPAKQVRWLRWTAYVGQQLDGGWVVEQVDDAGVPRCG